MYRSSVLLPLSFKLKKKKKPSPTKKNPFNQSYCQKGRVKIVKVQRRAVKIILACVAEEHGRRRGIPNPGIISCEKESSQGHNVYSIIS